MTRRKMMLMTAGASVLGVAALIGFANHSAILADDDDEGQEALIKLLDPAKINLQQGLAASEQGGQPISAKFEVEDGKLQLSVYSAKDGKFFEALVNHVTGQILRIEPITEGDDLKAANSQSATMAKANRSLKEAVDKATAPAAKARAISVMPSLKDGHPVASIVLLDGEQFKTVEQPLD
ncbi:PepSY domain-containing protein [Bradyrhizobium sp. 186]|uniref:PepSY domain-containing protein n=1 Tax=Bradyrhizobium sp. 186 TaxID=2782654 RepID=UPI002000B3F0|nr:PepSY domain-containing protein [Bradyrhizobium sp. 186]UPK37157.1 PepSY domain-containing protein [Bradyrhizobium sp. 186]